MILEELVDQPVEEENYFISMTDMMVGLVFIFIILLMYFALQFRDVTEQLAGADTTRAQILKKLQQTLQEKGVDVTVDTQNGVLRLPDAILFDSAQANLKPSGLIAVEHLADALAEVLPCYTDNAPTHPRSKACPETKHRVESVYIEGHTDTDALTGGGLFKDNWDLSVVRATNTYRAIRDSRPELETLCAKQGSQCAPVLSVSGYGAQRPVLESSGTELEQKQRNRRIDLRLIMVTPDSGQAVKTLSKRLDKR